MRHFRPFFSNFDKCPPEAARDVVSGVAVNYVGMDVPAKFGDARLNSGRTRFTHFCTVFNCLLQPTGRASDVICGIFGRPTVPDKRLTFRDPRLNRSR